jgi:hypothetical protein
VTQFLLDNEWITVLIPGAILVVAFLIVWWSGRSRDDPARSMSKAWRTSKDRHRTPSDHA